MSFHPRFLEFDYFHPRFLDANPIDAQIQPGLLELLLEVLDFKIVGFVPRTTTGGFKPVIRLVNYDYDKPDILLNYSNDNDDKDYILRILKVYLQDDILIKKLNMLIEQDELVVLVNSLTVT